MIEVIDDGSRERQEVYARYGRTMYLAQYLEAVVTNLLRLLIVFEGEGVLEFESFLEKKCNRTLSRVIKYLEPKMDMSDNLMTELNESKCIRNDLAHSYFRRRAFDFMIKEGCQCMIDELESFISKLENVCNKMESIYSVLGKPYEDELRREFERRVAAKRGLTEQVTNASTDRKKRVTSVSTDKKRPEKDVKDEQVQVSIEASPLDPEEFTCAFDLAIEAAEHAKYATGPELHSVVRPEGGTPVHLYTDTPNNRALLALREYYQDNLSKMRSATLRFFALDDLLVEGVLGKWADHEAKTIHPAVIEAVAIVELTEDGDFPEDQFLETVQRIANEKYSDSQ